MKMMRYKYILVKNIYYEETEFTRFGIAVLDISDGSRAVIRTAADLTKDIFTAQALADKCNTDNISISELDTIIDEFLSRNKL